PRMRLLCALGLFLALLHVTSCLLIEPSTSKTLDPRNPESKIPKKNTKKRGISSK
ncbi:hypothetical protein KUCAC02_036894, partial [Chaenocephalus aceratus]